MDTNSTHFWMEPLVVNASKVTAALVSTPDMAFIAVTRQRHDSGLWHARQQSPLDRFPFLCGPRHLSINETLHGKIDADDGLWKENLYFLREGSGQRVRRQRSLPSRRHCHYEGKLALDEKLIQYT